MKNQQGFTLIELSMALVIIGLIVGGVLVGTDMMRASEQRAQISQVQEIETAMTTFKLKYNCLAGDCKNATQFFSNVSNGNGDKRICRLTYNSADSCSLAHTNSTLVWVGGSVLETSSVFDHLASAGLINMQPYDETATASLVAGIGFPLLKYQGTGTQAATNYGSKGGAVIHYLKAYQYITEGHKLTLGGCGGAGGGAMGFYCGYKGSEAQPLDAKMDDGLPLTGRMRILGQVYVYRIPGDANNEVGNHCTTSTLANEYRVFESGNGQNRRCNLSINMPF